MHNSRDLGRLRYFFFLFACLFQIPKHLKCKTIVLCFWETWKQLLFCDYFVQSEAKISGELACEMSVVVCRPTCVCGATM